MQPALPGSDKLPGNLSSRIPIIFHLRVRIHIRVTAFPHHPYNRRNISNLMPCQEILFFAYWSLVSISYIGNTCKNIIPAFKDVSIKKYLSLTIASLYLIVPLPYILHSLHNNSCGLCPSYILRDHQLYLSMPFLKCILFLYL